MALDATRLAAAIKTNIETQVGAPAAVSAELIKFATALAMAIVAEFTGHAVVTTTGADPQGGSVNSTGTVS